MECRLGHDTHKIGPWSPRCKLALHFIAPTQTWTIKTVGREACVIPRVYSKLQTSNGLLRVSGLTLPEQCVWWAGQESTCFRKAGAVGCQSVSSLCQAWSRGRGKLQ